MGLFNRNYDKPGPGIEKDTPSKRGLSRFWEVLVRDMGSLVKLSLLYQMGILPSQVLLFLAIQISAWFWPLLVLSVTASAFVGPAKTAVCFCITKMLRDDPGFLWYDFKKAFKENFKQTVMVGIGNYCVIIAQTMLLISQLYGGGDSLLLVLLLVSALVFHMVMPYYYVQAAYIRLGNGAMIKNSLLLAFGNLPRSFGYSLLQVAGGGAVIVLFPVSLFFTAFIGCSLVALIGLMLIWPPVDRVFSIAETIKERDREL